MRNCLKEANLVLAALGLLSGSIAASESLRAQVSKPNIVLILADDLGWTEVGVPPDLKGRSVRALVEGRMPASWPKTVVAEGGEWRMLRSNHCQYTVYSLGENREMLTDMVKDPGEMKNLALVPEFAPVLAEHRRLLQEWYQQNGETLDSKYLVSGMK